MQNIFSKDENRLFELIALVRSSPPLYLGSKSIIMFSERLAGYSWACMDYQIKDDISFLPLDIFQSWIYIKYSNKMMISYDMLILMVCNNDEARALDVFFADWDEFLAQDHEKLKRDFLDANGRTIRFPDKYWCHCPENLNDAENSNIIQT